MSESIKRWVPIPTGVEVDVGTYGTDELDTEEIAYLLRVGGIDARPVGQAVSSAQDRATEVIAADGLGPNVTGRLVRALAAAGLLVDDDTARLVALGRAVEQMERLDERASVIGHGMWNACLRTIHRKAAAALNERNEG